jgi:Tfp pilus assembly protein PilF
MSQRSKAAVRIVIGFVAVCFLAGCASQQDLRKPLRESEGYYKEGESFLATDQQRALVAFQKAIQLNPDNFDAHYALGSIYFQRKEFSTAEREFRASLEINPNSGEALNYLGRVLMVQQLRRPEAIEVLRKATALPLYPTPDLAYTDLGSVLEIEGDLPGAIQAYQNALKIDPPNFPRPILYLSVGRVYLKLGDSANAQTALSQAKTLDPDGTVGTEASRLMQRLK